MFKPFTSEIPGEEKEKRTFDNTVLKQSRQEYISQLENYIQKKNESKITL